MPFLEERLSLTLVFFVLFMFNYDFNRTMTGYTIVLSTTYFSNNLSKKGKALNLNYICSSMGIFLVTCSYSVWTPALSIEFFRWEI